MAGKKLQSRRIGRGLGLNEHLLSQSRVRGRIGVTRQTYNKTLAPGSENQAKASIASSLSPPGTIVTGMG
jgi:hypothetical protein